jgi:hypothetical protein
VLSDGQTTSLKKAIQYVNHEQNAVESARFNAPVSTSSTSTVSAICNDGTPSYSEHAQGTCSYHDGDHWVNYPGT